MGGIAAVVIMQAGIFVDASRQIVRVTAQVELDFNSVERVAEYLKVQQEATAPSESRKPPRDWPSKEGKLEVENLTVAYAPELPPVLIGLSFSVNPGEKIGVVGRTGSGKSTLALSLLRMIEATEGRIMFVNWSLYFRRTELNTASGLMESTLAASDLKTCALGS